MIVLAGAVVIGCLLGLVSGGHLRGLAEIRMRAWPLLGGALVAQAVLGSVPPSLRWVLAVADCLAIAAWCFLNCSQRHLLAGLCLVGTGVVLNATVMAANDGMPVSTSALAAAGLSSRMSVSHGHLYKHVVMTSRSSLRFLGDVIPVQTFRIVLSPGDILILAGIATVAFTAIRRSRKADQLRITATTRRRRRGYTTSGDRP